MTEASPAPQAPQKAPPERVDTGVTTVRKAAQAAIDTTSIARDVAGKTSTAIEANPLAVLAGGIALGVLAGAFAPRTARETALLAPVGKRLSKTARGAVQAARDAAKSELDMLGLTRSAARGRIGAMLGDVVKALTVAGAAALSAAKVAPPAPPPPAPKKKARPKA